MDFEHGNCEGRQTLAVQGDKFFFNTRASISRNSSVGCSSRVFYYRSTEGVPFQWELQPGTPKDPRKEETIPPLSPPPAVLSLGLPKPCIDIEEPKPPLRLRFKFWKRMKKYQRSRKPQKEPKRSNAGNGTDTDKFERFEFYSSNGEFMASPSTSCSSSSSLPFSNAHSRQSSRVESPGRDALQGPYGCIPWNFNSIIVCVARRV